MILLTIPRPLNNYCNAYSTMPNSGMIFFGALGVCLSYPNAPTIFYALNLTTLASLILSVAPLDPHSKSSRPKAKRSRSPPKASSIPIRCLAIYNRPLVPRRLNSTKHGLNNQLLVSNWRAALLFALKPPRSITRSTCRQFTSCHKLSFPPKT
jgi:hypothetical protein